MTFDGGRVVGVAALLVGVLALVLSLRLDDDALTGGPATWFLPAALAVIVTALGGAIALRRSPGRRADTPADAGARSRVVGTAGAVVLYAVAFERLGFLAASALFVAALLVFYGERRWPMVLAVAVAGAGVTYAVFARWLGVPLP